VLGAKIERLGTSRVRWFPMQADVTPFLHAADLVVFPTWLEEGFGRVVIEGMATGRPVVASRIGAVPEILSGAMDRFLVEPRSSQALGEAIVSFIDWRVVTPGLGEECAQWVAAKYPYDRHVSALADTLARYSRRKSPIGS